MTAPADPPLRVELVPAANLPALAAAWYDLAARSLEPNALATPAFAGAALAELADVSAFSAVAIWQGSRLVGWLALRADSRRWLAPLGLAEVMAHNYGPLGVPLFDRDLATPVAAALFAFLRANPLRQRFIYWPFLTADGAAAAVLRAALRAEGLRWREINAHHRALAEQPGQPGAPDLSPKRRKSLARTLRRLAEQAPLRREIAVTPEEVSAATEIFLDLELRGWKGRFGTATRQRTDRLAFFTRATAGMAASGRVRIHVWWSGATPVAAGLALIDAPRAWFWKIAYDEAFAAFSPGVQLTLALTEDVLACPGVVSIDSLADADHPMIDHLWPGRLAMADWIIDLTPGGRRLRLGLFLERARNLARSQASALRSRLRRR